MALRLAGFLVSAGCFTVQTAVSAVFEVVFSAGTTLAV